MKVSFVPCQDRDDAPFFYSCWLQVGKVLVKEVGPSKGYAYWKALRTAYLTLKGVQL